MRGKLTLPGYVVPKMDAKPATDQQGVTYGTPDNSAEIYAAINQTAAGIYISIWSLKAHVWVRLLNRYGSRAAAEAAIDDYGFTLWVMAVPPHARDLREQNRQRLERTKR